MTKEMKKRDEKKGVYDMTGIVANCQVKKEDKNENMERRHI